MSEGQKNKIIWDNFREGSKEALEVIYQENYTPLFHYGMKFTGDEHTVKDTIHELFIELINSGEKLGSTDNIRFYLLRALRNKLVRQLQKPTYQQIENNPVFDMEFSLLESIENQLIEKEVEEANRTRITHSINKLSQKQQEIIYLRFYSNLPYSEIATLFQVKIQTVRNLMNRAINSIKADLEGNQINKDLLLLIVHLPL